MSPAVAIDNTEKGAATTTLNNTTIEVDDDYMGAHPSRTWKEEDGVTYWDPAGYFEVEGSTWEESGRRPFALVILNQEITDGPRLRALWRNARHIVCADGGANRLFDHLDPTEREHFLPTAITGDFDSLRPSVRVWYEARGVPLVHDPSQDSTDFGKSMNIVRSHDPESSYIGDKEVPHPKMTVLAMGGIGGRVDQSFHSIHALYTAQDEGRRLIVLSQQNITFLLAPGKNVIKTPRDRLGPTCGVLPVGRAVTLDTDGLVWDIKKQESKFGGLVSTSNALGADKVTIETSAPVVFTVEFKSTGIEQNDGP